MLPAIQRWSDDKVLDEAADRIARMALGACDGLPHGSPFYPARIGYPTRRNTEALVRLALAPDPDADAGYQRGFALDQLFAAAWDRVVADEGDDLEAQDLLVAYRDAIAGGQPWTGSAAEIDAAVEQLASFAPESLWVRFVQAAYPLHPQTPGSPGWIRAEERGNPHETVDNPFLRKP